MPIKSELADARATWHTGHMRQLYVIAHNMRSTFNVGSLLRTAEGLGVQKIFFTGYTPYPKTSADQRLPHVSEKIHAQIHKTALGAEKSIAWEYVEDIQLVLRQLKDQSIPVAALEQSPRASNLPGFKAPEKLALVLGEEVHGVPSDILERIEIHLEIPMFGTKESFNVVQAAAMALYEFRFH